MGGELLRYVVDAAVVLGAGAAVFALWVANRKRIAAETLGRAEEQASRVLRDAEREGDTRRKEALLDAKERAHELRLEAEQYVRDHRQQITSLEQILTRRESALTEQLDKIQRADSELSGRVAAVTERERSIQAAARKYDELVAHQQRELERVSGLTAESARELLIRQIEGDARRDAANLVKRLEAEAREHAEATARSIITQAIQRSAADHTIETTVSVVDLPSDDLKGRVIGRLIADGRIHPARIEEVVEKVNAEMEDAVRKDGEAAAFELGLHDLHPDVLRLMGRLRFRTSYGQNILHHSREVAYLAGIMARELGLDATVAVRAAFLHDIGKAIDRDIQGTHLELGLDFLKKHGESEPVLQAVAAHHMDIDWPSLEAMIVQAADAISAARPGARRDILESYVKRLEKLEEIADSFKGVSKAFALQAGREIRILVESERISDEEAVWLSKDIARRIENELEYPGHIKVTVIRETRAVEYAK